MQAETESGRDPVVPAASSTTAERPVVLEMRGITKRYPGVLANDHIDLELRDGEILLNGESIQITEPADAIARGIGMVHQHFMLVPVFTVAENISLGQEP